MHTHPNARLTPVSRERLVRRHIQDAEPLAHLAAQAGVSLRTAYKWLSRYRCGGAAALVDRRSVRRSQRRTLDPQHLQRAVALRHERCTLRRIARLLALPLSTVGRTLKAMGLGRLKHLQPPVPVRRYQWARPGDMIHVDIKQLARFDRVGHRITGDRRQGRSSGAGYEKAHVAIDDATRLAYAEVLPDEKQATTVGYPTTIWLSGRANQVDRSGGGQLNPVAMRRAPGHACSPHRSTDCAVHVQTTSRQPPGGGCRSGGHLGEQCSPNRLRSPATQSRQAPQ